MCEQCLAPEPINRRRVLSMAALGLGALAMRGCPPPAPARVAVAPGLEIAPRSSWAGSSRPPLATFPDEDARFLLVHHTATTNNYAVDAVAARIRSSYDFHTSSAKGWADVCYHFMVDRYGGVWEARAGSLARAVVADATGGNQGFSQLVCLIGDFTSVLPTPAALASLRRVLAWLAHRSGIATTPGSTVRFVSRGSNRWPAGATVNTPTITGHRTMSYTGCPGDRFFPQVRDALTAEVAAVRQQMFPT